MDYEIYHLRLLLESGIFISLFSDIKYEVSKHFIRLSSQTVVNWSIG